MATGTSTNIIDLTITDEFDNLMRAYDAATAVFDMIDKMEGTVIEDTHAALFNRMFNSMVDAKEAFTEMAEDARTNGAS